MNETAATIRNLRVAKGLSDATLAAALGVTVESYGDLERYNDELVSTLSLAQVRALAQLLGVELSALLGPQESKQACSLAQLAQTLRAGVAASPESLSQAEESVGWELQSFLRSPALVAEQRPIMFLQALAEHCQVGWHGLLAPANAA